MLLTSPISPTEIIIGKFLASLVLYLILLVLTLQYPIVIARYSPNFDWGPVISGYLGMILLGSAFISVGIFTSTLSENQIVAAITSFGILLLFWMSGFANQILDNTFGEILENLSLLDRYVDFLRGIVDTGNIIFFIVFTIIWLFIATKLLESDRWR